jgi:hypothetical protein
MPPDNLPMLERVEYVALSFDSCVEMYLLDIDNLESIIGFIY